MKNKFYFFLYLVLAAGAIALAWYASRVFSGDLTPPSTLTVGGFSFRIYGLLTATAVIAGWLVIRKYASRFGIEKNEADDLLVFSVIGGFIGARLYYVFFNWPHFSHSPLEILAVWKGGLAIYGAFVGGALGVALFSYLRKKPFLSYADLIALAVPLAQAIGRWGNFFNQEAFGRPTNLPWKMYVAAANRPFSVLDSEFFHPAFLYEFFWDLAVFAALLFLIRRGSQNRGVISASFLIFYGVGRYFIEGLRLDSFWIGSVRADQITSLLAMLIGAIILLIIHANRKTAEKNP